MWPATEFAVNYRHWVICETVYYICVCVLITQLCLTLCDPMDCSPHGLQAPLPMEFSRQEHWSGLPFPSPGDLPHPGIKPKSPALQADSLLSDLPEAPFIIVNINFLTAKLSRSIPICWLWSNSRYFVFNLFWNSVLPLLSKQNWLLFPNILATPFKFYCYYFS